MQQVTLAPPFSLRSGEEEEEEVKEEEEEEVAKVYDMRVFAFPESLALLFIDIRSTSGFIYCFFYTWHKSFLCDIQ